MLMSPIEPRLSRSSHRIVRLLRRWTADEGLDGSRLVSLVRLAGRISVPTEAAVALASLFELTEACLGRKLESECCCSPSLSRDEQAVLRLLAVAIPRHPHDTRDVPHGLPGALLWAVASVRRLLGEQVQPLRGAAGVPVFTSHSCGMSRRAGSQGFLAAADDQ